MHSSREFHKSSYSANESACVEVSEGAHTCVRDTQNKEAGYLVFPAAEWSTLLELTRHEARTK
ncbi:DUF397 domain-containing protein [Nocardiopsis sp. JB363]|uniref:DUF397 domain-containing protein n=1 Tax=Nocardiopsis sp. JB363 TaxID=1434837 RepID=UPI000B34F4A3|nr:DUF397 domain-containing protein [Nocardiopsis sp. JB363]